MRDESSEERVKLEMEIWMEVLGVWLAVQLDEMAWWVCTG